MAKAISSLNYDSNIYSFTLPYGVCDTAADTLEKTVTVPNFSLETGATVIVKFTYANSIASPTLNVNGTGAKPIMRYGTTATSTGTTTTGWIAGAVQMFTYDGTNWIRDYWNNTTYSNVSLGQGYCTCSTAATTVAKTASLSSYSLTTGGIVAVKFTNGNTASKPTLNINSKGAKSIYYNGAALTDTGLIEAGDIVTMIYSSYYHIISIDKAGVMKTAATATSTLSHNGTFTAITGLTIDGYNITPTTTTYTLPSDNNTVYTHPTYTARTGKPTENQTPAFGGTATVSQITSDGTGHVTAATDRTITIPSTLSNGTSTAGLIKTSSTVTSNSGYTACPVISGVPYYKDTNTTYTHPTTSGNKHIPSGGSSGQILRWSADGTAVWGADNDTKNTAGSTNSSDKLYLIGAISQATSPQTYSHDTAYVGTDGYLYSNSEQVNPRIYTTLVPAGTVIPANADLNSVDYLKVGNYCCSSNATVKTLKNCPLTTYGSDGVGTNGAAFMMQVYSPLLATFDDETTGTWRYRIRKIIHYNTGIEYTQYCYVGGTAGAANWSYGTWYVTPRSAFTFNKTAASTAAIGSTTNPVYVDSTGEIKKTTYTLGKSVPSNAVFTDTNVTQNAAITTNGAYPVILGNSTATTAVTGTVNKTDTLNYNPSTLTLQVGESGEASCIRVGENLRLRDGDTNGSFIYGGADGTALEIGAGKLKVNDVEVSVAGHTHSYAGSSSAGGAATSANKVNTNLAIKLNSGTTEGTNLFTFNGSTAKTVNITPSAIGAAASSHTHSYLPLSGGTLTGGVTHNAATYFNYSTYMKNGVGYNAYDTSGNACILLCLNGNDDLILGTTSHPHPGNTSINAPNGIIKLNACTECNDNIIVPNATSYSGYGPKDASGAFYRRSLLFVSENDNIHIGSDAAGSTTTSCHQGNTYINARKGNIYLVNGADTITFGLYTDTSTVTSFFRPATSGAVALGSSDHAWYQVATDRLYVYEGRITCKPTYENTVSAAANMYCGTGGVYSRTTNTSSRTIKHDIDELKNEDLLAENLYDLPIHQFKYDEGIITDEDDVRYMQDLPGFIIEEMEEIYPIAVDKPSDDVKEWSWNAQYLIPPMLKLIQNQKKMITDLEDRITQLEELIINN